MKRSVLWSICGLAFFISVSTSVESRPKPNWVKLDAKGNVTSFYGIPVTLTRAGLKQLPYRVTTEHSYSEGVRYNNYRIRARNNVAVVVTFERNGKLYDADTKSKNAVGPKGIGVGSTLAEVRAAWPKGELLFGFEDGYFVTYVTGTNVLFRFNPDDMPPGAFRRDRPRDFPVPENIKVQTISLFMKPIPVSEGAKQVDLTKNTISAFNSKTQVMISKLEIERAAGSSSVRFVWHAKGKVQIDRIVDLSKYPDIDIYGVDKLHPDDPLVVSFRYGNFKNCDVEADDRDKVYIKLDGNGAIVSSQFPEGYHATDFGPMPKYVGNTIGAVAHGCRRTFDPKTGASGLEKAD